MPNGSDRVTSHPLQELQPTKTIDDPEIKAWLALGIKTKKKGGGKKKKGKPKDHVVMLWCLIICFPQCMKFCIICIYHMQQIFCLIMMFGVVCTAKKEDKAEESVEAQPQDSTNGATPKEWVKYLKKETFFPFSILVHCSLNCICLDMNLVVFGIAVFGALFGLKYKLKNQENVWRCGLPLYFKFSKSMFWVLNSILI